MARNRTHRGLVALSAATIAVVYAAGYIHTQAADAALGATDTAPTAAAAPSTAPPTPKPAAQSTARTTQASGSPAGQTPPPPAKAAFKDGTYTGVGNSRRGGVQVAVAVQSGRIASVNITRVSTEYPPTDIAALPREVVSRQSAQVDFVSGATFSSLAFRAAVQQALSKAHA